MATVPAAIPTEQRFVLDGVDYDTYLAFADRFAGRRIRFTYDGERLELMSPSSAHERDKKVIARLVETLTEELGLPLRARGSMTFRRPDLARGMEPDECYWIASAARVRDPVDLAAVPPPELVIEVEVSRSLLDRMDILGRLGMPEVWRWDGAALHVHVRDAAGSYQEVERSPSFPFLDPATLARFMARAAEEDENAVVRAFRRWVRERASGWGFSPPRP